QLVLSRHVPLIEERRQLRYRGDPAINYYELEITNKQGRKIPISMTSTPVFKEGKLDAILVVARDITARKEMEAHLAKMQELHGFIVENADDLISILDEKGRFEWVNGKAHQKLLGYTPDELIGRYPVKFAHPDDKEILQQEFKKGMERGFFKLDVRICTKPQGTPIWLETFGRVIVRDDGKKIISVSRDISKQKEMELLKDEEVERLKQLDELRKSFVSNATHELKTPLSSVIGAAEFLREHFSLDLPAPALRMMDLIVSGARRLKGLIDHILDFSRLQMGKLALRKEPADLLEIVNNAMHDMEYLAEQKGLDIRVQADTKDTLVECDAFRVEQVLNNFLSNAIKNTNAEKKGDIVVRLREHANSVEISVIDGGIGITEDEMKILFTPFGKLEREHANIDIQGTGLGLYISKEIIELHGGKVWVESAGRNAGSMFSFTLPR
nr:PAS domain-containing sensor histidine kinase [Candidatus Sigynarchaeota archaeon]